MPANLWTDKELIQLRELHAAGYKPREIAEVMERGPTGVERKLQKMGLHYQIVQVWTDADIAVLKDMRANNVIVRAIAAKLNFSTNAVEHMIRKLKLPISPRAFCQPKPRPAFIDPIVYTRFCTIAHLQDIHRHHGFEKTWANVEPVTRYIKHVGVAA